MLKDIKIENYRGIKNLEIKDFKKINIFVGNNNSNKTALLESLFLSLKPYGSSLVSLYGTRNLPTTLVTQNGANIANITSVQSWIHHYEIINKYAKENQNSSIEVNSNFKFNLSRKVIIKPFIFEESYLKFDKKNFEDLCAESNLDAENSNFIYLSTKDKKNTNSKSRNSNSECYFTTGIKKTEIMSESSVIPDDSKIIDQNVKKHKDNLMQYPTFKIFYYNSIVKSDLFLRNHYDRIRGTEQEKELVDLVKIIDPTIEGFAFDKNSSIEVLLKNKKRLPLALIGDGVKKLFSLLCTIRYCENGVLLIDEIENGFYYKTQKVLLESLFKAAKEANVQIFATTHSYEMIKNLSEVYQEEGKKLIGDDQIRLFKIRKSENDKIDVIDFNSEVIKHVIEDEREVR